MFALLLQAISLASRPDSTEVLTEAHLKPPKRKRLQKLKIASKNQNSLPKIQKKKSLPNLKTEIPF